jgi:23S rRNA pseudouridine2605 synthase
MTDERIQKILAQAGFGSRRACEEYIRAGRITVNGLKVELGAKANPAKDKICVDLKPIPATPEPVYIALNKPRQVLSAIHQDDNRQDILDLVPFEGHLFPIGRLDYDSEGLIILTNDGDFANKLSHPRYEHEKEYIVQVGSRPDDSQLEIWQRGVVLEDGYRTAPVKIDVIETSPKSATLKIIMHEGRKRQIRETGGRIGIPVLRIKRVRIGTIQLGTLKPGEWRNLTHQELVAMREVRRAPKPRYQPAKASMDNKDTFRQALKEKVPSNRPHGNKTAFGKETGDKTKTSRPHEIKRPRRVRGQEK